MILVGASGNNPKNDFEAFLKNYAWALCVAVVIAVILTILIIFLVRNKKQNSGQKQNSNSIDEWFIALGGKDNILEISSSGSRLSLKLKKQELIDRESLTKLGVKNVVTMSDKITLVTTIDNQKICEKLKNHLQN